MAPDPDNAVPPAPMPRDKRGWRVAHRTVAEMHAANGFQYADDELAQAFGDITYLNAIRD